MQRINSFTDLDVYKRAYSNAVKAQKIVNFLRQIREVEAADQLSRSSKAVPALTAEGYAKTYQPKHLQKYLDDAIGESNESIVHISLAADIGFPDKKLCQEITSEYNIVGKQLYTFGKRWSEAKKFPNSSS